MNKNPPKNDFQTEAIDFPYLGDKMRYTAILQRIKEYTDIVKPNHNPTNSTEGRLTIYDIDTKQTIYECYTIERGGESTDTPNKDKRIMPRTYKLYWTTSHSVPLPNKFSPKCISLYCDELPTFKDRRIHIHIGNYPQDSEGCILLNETCSKGIGSHSRTACDSFYDLVDEIGIDNIKLTIREIATNE